MGRLSSKDINFIKENIEKMTNREMAEVLGCDASTISNWRKKLGISFSDLHDFSQYDQYIIDNYNKKTSTALAKEIGCSKSYIGSVWRENGLKGKTTRIYYGNFNYFHNIDSPTKAYLVGLIAADGCVYKRDNHEGAVQITLNATDKELLEQIKAELQLDNPISLNKKNTAATLSVVSEKMFQDLVKIGIVPRKTYELDFDFLIHNIPKQYWKDFFLGYFDGDGSITVREVPSKAKVQFAIPEAHKDSFIRALNELGIAANWNEDGRKEKYTIPFGSVVINGATNRYCLLKLMYLDSKFSLLRKAKLSQELCDQIKNNITNRAENKTAVVKWGELLESLRR